MFKFMVLAATSTSAIALTVAPASADVGSHCQQDGYCLFSGTSFTGTKVAVPSGSGCAPVTGLGFAVARSAARGYGDSKVLELFSDTQCATSLGVVSGEVASTAARAYRLISIPA
ncbi:MAG TPA: hypothetical protein VGL47_10895 [Amycolatopsis sp.]|uniref:Peptidase inhibitor family I36 n=1 Tax=Amycolatopsis nalaikhensis TaxID=715472 RepID=A0ABY8XZK5_9PSEU|nr:hypothetical protein [Amycolatopsis sp. 2-2]WIV61048.1 hypothetical protein QP939_21830 [Amycolatopsis sp. 2-2]